MPLMKFEDFYGDDQQISNDTDFSFDDIKRFDVYAQDNEKVGTVTDVLVDDVDGRFRYFVVDTGFWIFGKKVLLPVGSARISHTDHRIDVTGLTKEQVENLPNFDNLEKLDYEHEENVRSIYRPLATTSTATTAGTATANMAATPSIGSGSTIGSSNASLGSETYDRDSYTYDRDPALYNLTDRDHQSLKLYEERLIANKHRQKTGEVVVGKTVNTEQAHVAVPVKRERVVVERVPVSDQSTAGSVGDAFNDSEVARVEVYEETPDVRKEAFVREEVQVKKVSEQELVEVDETLRREELDVDAEGNPIVDKRI